VELAKMPREPLLCDDGTEWRVAFRHVMLGLAGRHEQRLSAGAKMHSFAKSCWGAVQSMAVAALLGMSWTLSSPEQKGSGGAPVINLTTSKALGIEPAQLLAPADEVIE
jgi:hypothetical protein